MHNSYGLSYYVLSTLPCVYMSKGKIEPSHREELMETRRVCKGVSSLTLLYVSSQCVDDTTLVRPSICQLLPGIWCRVIHRAEEVIRKVDLWSRWRPSLFRVSLPVALCINSLPRPTRNTTHTFTHIYTNAYAHHHTEHVAQRQQLPPPPKRIFHDRISSSSSSSAPLRLS